MNFQSHRSALVRGRQFLLGIALVLLSARPEARAATSPPELLDPATLQRWVATMATNHPSLRAAAARSLAARLNAEGTRRIADPQVQFAGTIYSPKGMEADQQGNLLYGVEQPLPLLGKEQAGRTVALRGAELEEVRADTRFQELQRDLTIALFEAALARRAVELAEADQTWMTDLIRSLEAQLASGTVSQVAVLRAQTELARRRFEVENLRSQESEALAGVNRRLGQDPAAPLPGFNLPQPAPPVDLNETLMARALETAPRRRVLEAERKEAGAVVEATRRSARPDIALGVQGMQYTGDGDFRSGTFGVLVNLPLWNRSNYRKDLARDRQRLRSVEEDQVDAALAVREEIRRLGLQIAVARRGTELYTHDILPKAEDARQTALAQWTAGTGNIRDVMESHRVLLETQAQLARATADQWTLIADLTFLCGLPGPEVLTSTPMSKSVSAIPSAPKP
jgi:cobalt-zinc-cadmium efflux system outer membrane protein